METSRRGNYNSGEDFVLEYGELRFTFNEEDFSQRCEQAAIKVGFVDGRLGEEELEDLVNLAVNGEISDPASELGEHVNDCWPELVGPSERSLVHWLRRLVFRGLGGGILRWSMAGGWRWRFFRTTGEQEGRNERKQQ